MLGVTALGVTALGVTALGVTAPGVTALDVTAPGVTALDVPPALAVADVKASPRLEQGVGPEPDGVQVEAGFEALAPVAVLAQVSSLRPVGVAHWAVAPFVGACSTWTVYVFF